MRIIIVQFFHLKKKKINLTDYYCENIGIKKNISHVSREEKSGKKVRT